jgi:hypothetical protein
MTDTKEASTDQTPASDAKKKKQDSKKPQKDEVVTWPLPVHRIRLVATRQRVDMILMILDRRTGQRKADLIDCLLQNGEAIPLTD